MQSLALSPPSGYLYQAYYCEENIWQLCRHPSLRDHEKLVVFLSNPTRTLAMWGQRAAPAKQLIVWDYHVILLARAETTPSWMVFDLDTLWGFPVQASAYFADSFAGVSSWPKQYQPMFRVIPSVAYVETFRSDRSHMLSHSGEYLQPPPPWPAIISARSNSHLADGGAEQGMHTTNSNLQQFIDVVHPFVGKILSLAEMQQQYVWDQAR